MVAVIADLCVPQSYVVLGPLEQIGADSVQPVNTTSSSPLRQRSGAVVWSQSSGSMPPGTPPSRAMRSADDRSSSTSGVLVAGSTDTNKALLDRATKSRNCRFFRQSVCGVPWTQSAATAKNLPCWAIRKASVLTPTRRGRSHIRPDVSSPIRCACVSPAASCPTTLQPSKIASPEAAKTVWVAGHARRSADHHWGRRAAPDVQPC